MAQRSLFLLLDIDNTLYEYDETGFGQEMHDLIFAYASEKLKLSHTEAEALSVKYYRSYGLSLRGYVEHYGVDAKDYSDYVHQCSYDRLAYNGPLVRMLKRLHYGTERSGDSDGDGLEERAYGQQDSVLHHLYFFTNANRPHARNVLTPLGLRPLFTRQRQPGSPATVPHKLSDEKGFEEDTEWLGFSYEDQWRLTGELKANKPMKAAYEAIFSAIDEEIALDELQLRQFEDPPGGKVSTPPLTDPLSVSSPTRIFTAHKRAHLLPENMVMVDDSLMNLEAPLELGWSVVWYAHGNQQLPAKRTATAEQSCSSFYAEAIAKGRMKIIRHILELEKAVEELAQRPPQ